MAKNTDFSTLPRIIAVDADGTLWTDEFPEIGKPRWDVIDAVLEEQAYGSKLILWTCRTDDEHREYLQEAIQRCKEFGLIFDAHNDNIPEVIERGWSARKVFACEYWDDKSIYVAPALK